MALWLVICGNVISWSQDSSSGLIYTLSQQWDIFASASFVVWRLITLGGVLIGSVFIYLGCLFISGFRVRDFLNR
jgi:putative peptidoglycan lipid II flippase